MNKKRVRVLMAALSIVAATSVLAGCGKTAEKTPAAEISGTITVLGSTALQPLAEQAAKNFIVKNSKANINVQGGGSGAGINQVYAGTANIGMSDVTALEKLKDEAKAKELTDYQVCVIGFAVVTSKDVTVTSLAKKQIQDYIYWCCYKLEAIRRRRSGYKCCS